MRTEAGTAHNPPPHPKPKRNRRIEEIATKTMSKTKKSGFAGMDLDIFTVVSVRLRGPDA